MRRILASLAVASVFALGCSNTTPTSPVPEVSPRLSLDCSNGNNGNNPPNTAGGGCGGNNSPQNSSNNPPTTAGN